MSFREQDQANDGMSVSTTFTFTCAWGCTVETVEGKEQAHHCRGVATVFEAFHRALREEDTHTAAAERIAGALAPLVREQLATAVATAKREALADVVRYAERAARPFGEEF